MPTRNTPVYEGDEPVGFFDPSAVVVAHWADPEDDVDFSVESEILYYSHATGWFFLLPTRCIDEHGYDGRVRRLDSKGARAWCITREVRPHDDDYLGVLGLLDFAACPAAQTRVYSSANPAASRGCETHSHTSASPSTEPPPCDASELPADVLTDRQELILIEMFDMKAVGRRHRVTRNNVADRVDPTKSGPELARDLRPLKRAGLISGTNGGRDGGIWLTKAGESKAAELTAENQTVTKS